MFGIMLIPKFEPKDMFIFNKIHNNQVQLESWQIRMCK